MADIKLFSLDGEVSELPSTSVALEKELQTVIEIGRASCRERV